MLQSKYFCCKPKIFLHPKFSEQLGPLPWWQARRSEKSGWSLSSIISILSWSLILETRRIILQVSWKKRNIWLKGPFSMDQLSFTPGPMILFHALQNIRLLCILKELWDFVGRWHHNWCTHWESHLTYRTDRKNASSWLSTELTQIILDFLLFPSCVLSHKILQIF